MSFMDDEPSIVEELREEENKGVLKTNNCKVNVDFFRLAVDNSADSVFLIDRKKMCFIDVNRTACESTGYSKDELLGMGPQHIKPELTLQELGDKFDSVLKNQDKKGVIETVHRRKDGSRFPVEVFLTCLPDDNVVIASVRDITERKKAEKKNRSLFKIVEQSTEGIVKTDKNFKIVYMNPAAEKLFGYNLEDLKGKEPDIFNAEPPSKNDTQKIYDAVSSGKTYMGESLNVRKNGSKFYCQYKVSPLKNDDGEITGYIVSQRDITDRKKAENKIKKSESRLRDFFDNANDLIQSVDYKGRFKFVNKKWKKVMGYSDDEIKNLHFTDIIHEDYLPHCKKIFKKLTQGESFHNVEVVFKTKEDEDIYVSGNLNSQMFDGEFVSTRGIFRDVTKRRKNEEKIKENEKKYREIFNNTNDAMYVHKITDKGMPGNFIEVNDVACKMLGYTKNEFKKMSPSDIDDPKTAVKIPEIMQELFEKGRTTFNMNHVSKDGKIIPIELSSNLFKLKDEDFILSIARDISDRKEYEEKIKASKKESDRILNAAGDGIRIVNKDFEVVKMNDTMADLSGVSKKEGVGMSCSEMFGAKGICGTKKCSMVKVLEDGQGFEQRDVRKTADGREIPCLDKVTPYIDENGEIIGIIEDFRDISKIIENEEKLKEKLDELKRWKRLTVGREFKMKKLKDKIDRLESKQ